MSSDYNQALKEYTCPYFPETDLSAYLVRHLTGLAFTQPETSFEGFIFFPTTLKHSTYIHGIYAFGRSGGCEQYIANAT